MAFRLQFHRRQTLACLTILGLSLAACEPISTPLPIPTSTPSSTPSSITVLPITPVSPTLGVTMSETIPIENCAGNRDVEVSLSAVTSYGQNITLGTGAEVGTGVEVGVPQVAQASLETKLSLAYESQIQQAQSRTNQITYGAAPHSHVEYTVDWVETLYISSAQVELGGITVSVPYTVTIYVPKPGSSTEIPCPTPSPTSIAPPPPTDTPTDTPTLTLTDTPTSIPTLTSTSTPTETPTITPTVTPTPTVYLMIIFADEDSLTVYVPVGVKASLEDLNLEYRTSTGTERYFFADSEGFAVFANGSVPPPFCLHLEQADGGKPFPQECQPVNVHKPIVKLPGGGIFWWDAFGGGTKNLFVNLGAKRLGVCATGFSRCEVEIN